MTHNDTAMTAADHGTIGFLRRFTRTNADQRPDTNVVRTSAETAVPNSNRKRRFLKAPLVMSSVS
jgi:hypothetical protein